MYFIKNGVSYKVASFEVRQSTVPGEAPNMSLTASILSPDGTAIGTTSMSNQKYYGSGPRFELTPGLIAQAELLMVQLVGAALAPPVASKE